ncbi:hypothetical protein CW704_02060 [Candidatus Bathyarchaeota archaeon]|nr:MAG: hypothetical protein CW704_02060 [Candidatus Bathyarchaeota archaeon]
MAKFMKHEVIGRILELGLVPIFYNGDLEVAKKIVQACVDGGAKIVEFTNREDFAYQVLSEPAKWSSSRIRIQLATGCICSTCRRNSSSFLF